MEEVDQNLQLQVYLHSHQAGVAFINEYQDDQPKGKSSDYVSHYSCQWKKFVVTFSLVFLAYRQEKCHDNFFPSVYMF